MSSFRAFVRSIVIAFDHAIGWLLAAAVVLNGVSVFMRYVMLDSISWSEEAIIYVSVWITFLGSVSASWFEEHLDMRSEGASCRERV